MAARETEQDIKRLRERIDEVDGDLVHALNERARLVQEVVALKAEAGMAPFDPKREEEILDRAVARNEGPIYDSSMRDIFEMVLHRVRDLEIQRGELDR